jgi:hypothetical protein
MTPRTQNCHEVHSKFFLDCFKLLVDQFAQDTCQRAVGHLGLDGLGRHVVRHGFISSLVVELVGGDSCMFQELALGW